MQKLGLTIAGVIMGIALSLGGAWWFLEKNYSYQGVVIDPPAPAPEISLTDQNGNPFLLSQEEGKVALIFFGYTNCPDICPITLAQFKKIKSMLGSKAGQVEFIFITVDPQRDSQERIREYLANFDPEFIGLSGDEESLNKVWAAYGVYEDHQASHETENYLVDHSARVYAIDPSGQWRLNYPFGMEAQKIANDVVHLLNTEMVWK